MLDCKVVLKYFLNKRYSETPLNRPPHLDKTECEELCSIGETVALILWTFCSVKLVQDVIVACTIESTNHLLVFKYSSSNSM